MCITKIMSILVFHKSNKLLLVVVLFCFYSPVNFPQKFNFGCFHQTSEKCVLSLFRCCLQLIEDSPSAVQEELDLIRALGYLEEFGVKMLPLQGTTSFYSLYGYLNHRYKYA